MLWTCKIPTRVRCLGQAIRLEICLKLTTLRILHKLFLLPPFRLIYGNSCLGHTFLSHLQLLASQDYLGSIQFLKFDCTSYHFGKQIKLPFNNSGFFFFFFLLLHFLILYILIFGILHQFPLRGDLDILS